MVTGYLNSEYAESLSEFGVPTELTRCGAWILKRQIAGFAYYDAMGCYPLFACQDWSQLHLDLEEIEDELVSLALVTDPFGDYDEVYLRRCFNDVVVPFKAHFVVDLSRPLDEIGSSRRRYDARRALRDVRVEVVQKPIQFLDQWVILYKSLVDKYGIRGLRAFSRGAFAKQLSLPGSTLFVASYRDAIVGAKINFVHGDVVYAHLAAFDTVGYEVGASRALDWTTIEYFAGKARWLNLGGGAGIAQDATDGLSKYKRGWSTDTRMAYFCGRIFDLEKYTEVSKANCVSATDYFPAYRKGEFL